MLLQFNSVSVSFLKHFVTFTLFGLGTYSAFYDIGEVRLTDQRRYSISKDSSYMNGRLEVYIRVFSSYRWTPFCYRYFDNDTADSACRQLGFDGVSEYDTVQNLG